MFNSSVSFLTGTILVAGVLASPVPQQPKYTLRTVHQFPNYTWIENMAVRSNGQILGTNIEGGTVLLIDPRQPQNVVPPIVAYFGNDTAVTGIAEVEDDVFYVQGIRNSNTLAFQFPKNTSTIWKVDMRSYAYTGHASVSKVADIPHIGTPNGMTLLSKSAGTLLIADSDGLVWRFCVRDGHYEMVIDDESLKPLKGGFVEFGVNGVKVIGSTLYFSNTNKGLLGTFQISKDGRATSGPHLITSSVPNADDFAVAKDGSVWLTRNVDNTIVHVLPSGRTITVASGNTTNALVGPVSARFGRTLQDENTLYITTDGLTLGSDGTPLTTDGTLAAIDTSKY